MAAHECETCPRGPSLELPGWKKGVVEPQKASLDRAGESLVRDGDATQVGHSLAGKTAENVSEQSRVVQGLGQPGCVGPALSWNSGAADRKGTS